MGIPVAVLFILGGATLVIARRPFARNQSKRQAKLGLLPADSITPTFVAFVGVVAFVIGALLLLALITGRVHF